MNNSSVTIPASVVEIQDKAYKFSRIENIIFEKNSNLRRIGKQAFYGCKTLKSITIPASVVEIDDHAFYESSITEIIFAEGSTLKVIGENSFYNCRNLKSIQIPSSVLTIKKEAFMHSYFEEVTFAENSKLQRIGERAFDRLNPLQPICIPSSVQVIDKYAFNEYSHQEIIFSPDSKLEIIGPYAFIKSGLKSINIPASVITICDGAFNSSSLERVTFEDQSLLKIIGRNAFTDCKMLPYVELPSKLVEIRGDVFFGGSGINKIIYKDNSPTQTRENNDYFIQLCREGDVHRCEDFVNNNNVNIYHKTETKIPKVNDFPHHYLFQVYETALDIALVTENIDLCIFLVKHKAHRYSEQHSLLTIFQDISYSNEKIIDIIFDTPSQLLGILESMLEKKRYFLVLKLLEKLKSNLALGIWKLKKTLHVRYDKIFPLILQYNSMELYQLSVDCGFNIDHVNLEIFLQSQSKGNIYDLILNTFLSTFPNLSRTNLDRCFYIAIQYGNVEIITKYIEIINAIPTRKPILVNLGWKRSDGNHAPNNENHENDEDDESDKSDDEDTDDKDKSLLFLIPHSKLDVIIPLLVPYIVNFNLIKKSKYYSHMVRTIHPETVLSYLAFTKSFQALKAIIESPTASFEPTHLVACSLFRGYFTSRFFKRSVSVYDNIFDYLMRDDIRPRVLGLDSEWVDKSIFICIRYATERMALKLLDLGADLANVYVHKKINETITTCFSRYTLLSYACKYQGIGLISELIKRGVPINGTMIDILGEDTFASSIIKDNIAKCGDNDEDTNEDGSEDACEDSTEVGGKLTKASFPFIYKSNIPSIASKPWFIPYFCRKTNNKNKDIPDYSRKYEDFRSAKSLCLFNMTPLAVALSQRKTEMIRFLLYNGADPNASSTLNIPTIYSLTPDVMGELLLAPSCVADTDSEIESEYGMKNNSNDIDNDGDGDGEVEMGVEVEEIKQNATIDLSSLLNIPPYTSFMEDEIKWKEDVYEDYEKIVCQIPHSPSLGLSQSSHHESNLHESKLSNLTPQKTSLTYDPPTQIMTTQVSRKKQKRNNSEENKNNTSDIFLLGRMEEYYYLSLERRKLGKKQTTSPTSLISFAPSPISVIVTLLLDHGLNLQSLLDLRDIHIPIQYYEKYLNLINILHILEYDVKIMLFLRNHYHIRIINKLIYTMLSYRTNPANFVLLYQHGFLDRIKKNEVKTPSQSSKSSKSRKLETGFFTSFISKNPTIFLILYHYGFISNEDTQSDRFLNETAKLISENLSHFLQLTKLLPQIFSLHMKNNQGVSLLLGYKTPYRFDLYHPQTSYDLLQLGLDVNHRTDAGDTLLLHSIKYDLPNCFLALVSQGADTSILDKDGRSCLDLLKESHQKSSSFRTALYRRQKLMSILPRITSYQDKSCTCSDVNIQGDKALIHIENNNIEETTKELLHSSTPLTTSERKLLQSSIIPGYTAKTLSHFLTIPIVDQYVCMFCCTRFEYNDHCRPIFADTEPRFAHNGCFQKYIITPNIRGLSISYPDYYLVNPTKPFDRKKEK